MATLSGPIDREANINLTNRQRRLLEMIEYRRRHRLPTVQRDLAEALGIRRDSLNKLLARTRRRLRLHGVRLEMPPRSRSERCGIVSLGAIDGG